MKHVHIYCGKVNSQGGSKVSLLNIIFLLHKEEKNFTVYVNGKGWFTDQLEKYSIPYIILCEPEGFSRLNKRTKKFEKITIFLKSLSSLFRNWINIVKFVKKGDNVLINEPRDIILFLPFTLNNKYNVIQWVRSESIGQGQKLLLKRADKIVTVTEIVKKNLASSVSSETIAIHNFMLTPPIIKSNKSLQDDLIGLAVIGSIQKIKGQIDAVKILQSTIDRNEKFHLYIIGGEFDKEYTEKLKKYVLDNKLQRDVTFVGQIDNVLNFMDEFIHFLLVPSETEGFCRVAMEAFSVEVPVMAYRVGGLKEVVKSGYNGYLFNHGDYLGVSNTISELMNDTKTYETLRKNSKKDWELRFYSESIKHKLFKLFV